MSAVADVHISKWSMLIGGAWIAADEREQLGVVDPATGETVAVVPVATSADLDAALEAVRRAAPRWAATDAWTRSAIVRRVGDILERDFDELCDLIVREQGKPRAEAEGEVRYAIETFSWFADEGRRIYGRVIPGHSNEARLAVLRQPIGPVLALTPWNFPIQTPARKLAAALAAGCPVILKPSEETPGPAVRLVEACVEAGVPAGAVNLVTGVPSQISTHLLASDVIRKMSFTGSVPVGEELMRLCANGIKVPTLELGGHAPVLVFADADIDDAVERCVAAKFRNAGQVCVAPSRFYVQRPVFERFAEAFAERAASLRIGPGDDPATEVGPLVNERRREAVEALIADAVSRGARVTAGGRRPESPAQGWFFEPTVLLDVPDDAELMVSEPFGPIAPILPFEDLEDGLALANATPFGLAGYAFTRDAATTALVTEGLEVGLVGVNTLVTSTVEAPFAGIKQSGLGAENGAEGIEAFTVIKYAQTRLVPGAGGR